MATFTVVVASGKGGTGKTLVATRLAKKLAASGLRTVYVDADVEAPNGHLALAATLSGKQTITRSVARVQLDKCTSCGSCVAVCAFGALFMAPEGPVALDAHCRDCRACELACGAGAISRDERVVGEVQSGQVGVLSFLSGTLRLGEQRGVPLVDTLRRMAGGVDVAVIDSPPGTACSAVAALRDADLAILVTEPTPFGEHDLKLARDLCRSLGVPAVGVLNRAGMGVPELASVVSRAGLETWAEIPYEPAIAAAVAAGEDPELTSAPLARAIETISARVAGILAEPRALAAGAVP